MIGQSCGLRQKIFERRALDFFHLAARAVAGVEVVLEERAEVDLFERILLFRRDGSFFGRGLGGGAVEAFFLAADIVDQGDGIFELFEDRILDHLGVDHVLELKFIEREDGDHLHQTRGEDLALGKFDA